jgi:thioredoxin-like negative regulator of GroEL
MRRALVVLCLLAGHAAAQEYQFEDNVRDLLASGKQLMSAGALEDGATEYENVLAIDPLHREAALALLDAYLQLGAIAPATELVGRLGRMGVDSAQQDLLKLKIEGVRKNPPKRAPYTASLSAAPAAPAAKPAAPAAADDALGDIDALDDGPAPKPVAPGSPKPAAPAAPPVASDLDLDL